MSIVSLNPVQSTPADDWGARFDAAQARFRQSRRKPVALVLTPDPLPMVASPINGIGDLQDPAFYETFAWSRELSARRLAVVSANVARINAELDAEEDAEADPADWPDWTDEHIWEPTEPESFGDDLPSAVSFHPINGPASRRADVDDLASAWHNGWSLGVEGFEADEVCPPQSYSADEANAFIAGVEAGAAERWADYGRYLDGLDRERTLEALHADPYRDVSDAELAEARMVRPAVAMA